VSAPIVIAGPTACGKSNLALGLARDLGGELICADSRQVYSGMRIGTAGPTDDERAAIPHHLFHAVAAGEIFDAARFVRAADDAVARIAGKGARPMLVGGTGLYLRAWRLGLDDAPPRDEAVRARLQEEGERLGWPHLHRRLAEVDGERAAQIAPTDPVRLVRALEIFTLTGKKPSTYQTRKSEAPPRMPAHWILLWPTMEWLTPRLEKRAAAMWDQGLQEEAITLRRELGAGHRLLSTMGYAEALGLADGILTPEGAGATMIKRQRQFARRQRTWFKKEGWWTRFDPAQPDLRGRVLDFLDNAQPT
jgi:tRNA dimethylallyltransferase